MLAGTLTPHVAHTIKTKSQASKTQDWSFKQMQHCEMIKHWDEGTTDMVPKTLIRYRSGVCRIELHSRRPLFVLGQLESQHH